MNDLKAAIWKIWIGVVLSLIGFFSYLKWGNDERALLIAATVMILIFAILVVVDIVQAKRQITIEALREPDESPKMLAIIDQLGTANMAAFFLGIVECLATKKGDTFFVLTVPLGSMILGTAGMLSFNSYMKRRSRLQRQIILAMIDEFGRLLQKAPEKMNKERLEGS